MSIAAAASVNTLAIVDILYIALFPILVTLAGSVHAILGPACNAVGTLMTSLLLIFGAYEVGLKYYFSNM